jgi:hypothetical protein
MLLYTSGPQCASDICENIIWYFFFFQEHVCLGNVTTIMQSCFQYGATYVTSICPDAHRAITKYIALCVILHIKNCAKARKYVGQLQI